MSLLPGFASEVESGKLKVESLITLSFRFLLLVLFLLITYHLSLITDVVLAAPGDPPNPQPCQDGILNLNKLTKSFLDPIELSVPAPPGNLNDQVPIQIEITVNVDFSKLQAIFASPNSNYLEGKFQDDSHRLADILSLPSKNFNLFHGPGQKTSAKVLVDDLRKKYVEYVYNKPTLPESTSKYTDIEGQGEPKTIYDLVNEFGLPNPPQAGNDKTQWLATWGRYWEKIPTAYSEFYYGQLNFYQSIGNAEFDQFKNNDFNMCPAPLRTIYFVMPEFWRTTSISDQLNQVIVPCAAQSWRHGLTEEENSCGTSPTASTTSSQPQPQNILSGTVSFCKKLISNSSKNLQKALEKVIKVSYKLLNPIKTAYAKEKEAKDCAFKLFPDSKKGSAPFCALPPLVPADAPPPLYGPQPGEPQLQPGEICTDVNDPNQLDTDNQNVNCTFKITVSGRVTIDPNNLDNCTQNGTTYSCNVKIGVWPEFRIPWLAEIWNNTTYSDEEETDYVGSDQKTGRPGIYTFFKPKSTDFVVFPNEGEDKNLPSQDLEGKEVKQPFFGATDCNKEFSRDIALKPKALQEALGITAGCKTGGQ